MYLQACVIALVCRCHSFVGEPVQSGHCTLFHAPKCHEDNCTHETEFMAYSGLEFNTPIVVDITIFFSV